MFGPGRIDPRQMARMMKQLGIAVSEVEGVREVIIRTATKDIVIEQAAVTVMDAQGQRTWQITGTAKEVGAGADAAAAYEPPASSATPALPAFSNEDIALVMTQAGVSKEKAKAALVEADGEVAAAIVKLTEEKA